MNISRKVTSPSASMQRWMSASAAMGGRATSAASSIDNVVARRLIPGRGALECHLIRESRSRSGIAQPGGV
jgi:hypothetical protein